MKEQNEISTVYMLDALDEARTAAAAGEVPVGACVVCGGEIISRAHNLVETRSDASAQAILHARMQNCLRSAQQQKNLALAA